MTEGPRPEDLTTAQRRRFEAFADVLMPCGSGLLAPSEAQVGTGELDRLILARPDLAATVLEVIGGDAEPADEIRRLRHDDPDRFHTFALALAATYLMNVQIRRGLGFPGAAPEKSPPAPGEADYYLEDGLLDPVVARGEIFRRIP